MELNIIKKAVLRMPGYPIDLLDNFKISENPISLDSFIQQTGQIRKNLQEFYVNNPDIREAIWISSENAYKGLKSDFRDFDINKQRDRKDKGWERLFTKFLFRFCYKNDTTSFFGPSSYISLNPNQIESIKGNLGDIVANRTKTVTRTASWVDNVPIELIEDYRVAKGVEQKKKIMDKIIAETKGEQAQRPWRWYTERTPVYDLCPANHTFSIGGKLLDDLILKSQHLYENIETFNSHMYTEAINKGFYRKLNSFLLDKTKSNHTLDWLEFIYNSNEPLLEEITSYMCDYGKSMFKNIFIDKKESIGRIRKKTSSPFFSPDLMVNSESIEEINKGNYEFIISDIHGTLTCFLNTFSHSLKEDDKKEIVELLNMDVFDKYNFYLPSSSIPDTVRWLEEFNVLKNISELLVYEKDGELRYNDKNAYLEFFINEAISKIIPCGFFGMDDFMSEQFDRIISNNVIIKRKSYKFSSRDYLTSITSDPKDKNQKWYNAFIKTREYLSNLKLGEVIFFKPDCEYKPFAIDINNPFSCEILESYAKRSEFIEAQEMLPNRKGLWLKNSNGKYTSELRLSFYEGKI